MKTFSSREGEIVYAVQGKGPRNFLLVHNAGGSHKMMHYTMAHFSKRGKTVVPDLLGHGFSAAPPIEYTVNLFAQSLIQLCKHEKLDHIVFIGLNYGGNVGLEVAQIAPHLISHLILIEPPMFMEPWIVKVVERHIKELANPSEQWVQETVDSVLMKASAEEREIALRSYGKTPSFVKASTYKNLLLWDKKHSSQCSIPTLMIQVSQPFCVEKKVKTTFPNLQVSRVVGSGPWATLEVPTQVHAMIDRFLEF